MFGSIFGGGTGGAGILGFADGGRIVGPGSGRSDSILAAVSNGEFVMNARATEKHLPLLEALNSGRLPAFANGGLVSASPISAPALAGAGGLSGPTITVAPNITAEGGSRGPEADQELAATISKQLETMVRATVGKELRAQSRPGGALFR